MPQMLHPYENPPRSVLTGVRQNRLYLPGAWTQSHRKDQKIIRPSSWATAMQSQEKFGIANGRPVREPKHSAGAVKTSMTGLCGAYQI